MTKPDTPQTTDVIDKSKVWLGLSEIAGRHNSTTHGTEADRVAAPSGQAPQPRSGAP